MNREQRLKALEAKLAQAKRELEMEERGAESSEENVAQIIDRDPPFKVEVVYNGKTEAFEVRHDEPVKSLLDKALATFGPVPNPNAYAIFEGGKELANDQTLEQSGVKPGDKLRLRPSEIHGAA